MSTPTRAWFPGASYHITNRGNHKETIFLDNEDYRTYLSIIKNTLEFYKELNYKLICYCLMSNHVHLLLKTDSQEPSFFMRRINSLYAKYFNEKYDYVGHLFQERYFSNIITSEFELLEISRYIHLNPVKANIVKSPTDYKWSSYIHIISDKPTPTNHPSLHYNEILNIIDIYITIEEHSNKGVKSKISSNTIKFFDKKTKYKKFVDNIYLSEYIHTFQHNKENNMNFHDRVLLNELKLNDTDDQIVEYIKENIEKVITQSIQKTSEELFTVPNSIVRLAKKLGYNGFSEMKFALKQELASGTFNTDINSIKNEKVSFTSNNKDNSLSNIAQKFKDTNYTPENIFKTLDLINNSMIEKTVKKIHDYKSVKFLGLGDSIYFCEMFSKNLRCVAKQAEFFQHRHDMLYSINNCDNKDLYIAISVSGESKQIIEAVEKAKEKGAYIISMTHFSDNSLSKLSDMKLFFWAPKEDKNSYNSTDRIGLMILIRIISEAYWASINS